MQDSRRDPREIITPDAFSVAPELLGIPLARPWRRASAMSIDLLAIAILTRAGWFFLGLGLSYLLFRMAFRSTGGAVGRGTRRLAVGSIGVLVLTVTLSGGWVSCFLSDEDSTLADATGSALELTLGEAGAAVSDLIALRGTDTEAEFREVASDLALRLSQQGVPPDDIEEVMLGFAETDSKPWAYDAIEAALSTLEGERPSDTTDELARRIGVDSLVFIYAASLRAGDSARASAYREPLVEAVAADRLARQEREISRLQRRNVGLQGDLKRAEEGLDEAREGGLIRSLLRAADEVGIGFGWSGLYFTFFVTVWRGRTLGKRLMRIRIVRLDGKPISWWVAFNRFGGYAASIFTGLLGFFEMFWDPNRQALHDRIAATVVVKEVGGRGVIRN